ncbi:MAG: metallophosphoesterase, partial [Candidatus Electryoneaceae bacterium]|nr:metallophosphoesterase [Candidatus Electryoneaceae bacterium]
MGDLKTFIIFLTIVLLIYGGVNTYLYRRIMQAAAMTNWTIWLLRCGLLFLILAYPISRFMRGDQGTIGHTLTWIGSFWLGVMIYGLLIAVLIDFVRIGDLLTGWLPGWIIGDSVQAGRIALTASIFIVTMVLIGGHIRSLYPVVREVTVELDRFPADREEYNIVIISDTHLGTLKSEQWTRRLVEQINNLFPDACLIVGDIVDEPPDRLQWAIEPLSELDIMDGVWAVTGNHEHYAGLDASLSFMQAAGINVLCNEARTVGDVMTLVGLDDVTGGRQFKRAMPSIKDIIRDADPDLPTVLMHHTPNRIQEAEEAGIDLMFSGHTHGGQVWPAGYITRMIFKVK